jgi:hypothetical protein
LGKIQIDVLTMRKFRLHYVLVFLGFSACQIQEKNSETQHDDSFAYSIDLNAESVEFIDQIESISIFGFEETDESLLNSSSLFLSYEDGIIVIDEVSGSVYKFDSNGAYLSKFNRMGGGPEEYKSMQNTVYRDGLIETYDVSKQQMSRYNLDGNFMSALKLPYRANHVFFNDDRYLLSIENDYKSDSSMHKIVFLDLEGKEYAQALPIDTPPPFPMRTNINDFSMVEEQLLYAALLTDSVLVIDDTEGKPFIQFDFGEDWFWTDEMYATENAMEALAGANKVWLYTWVLGPDRIEMTYSISFSEIRCGYIERSTGQFFEYKFKAWGGEYPGMLSIKFEVDKLLMVMTPDLLDVFINELGEERYTLDGLSLERIMKSENPVVVWVRFK